MNLFEVILFRIVIENNLSGVITCKKSFSQNQTSVIVIRLLNYSRSLDRNFFIVQQNQCVKQGGSADR